MEREIILYVGLHKTGSSSIQHTCSHNRAQLLAAGFVYPTYTMDGEQEANHTRLLRNLFRRNPGRIGLEGQFSTGGGYAWSRAAREKIKLGLMRAFAETPGRLVLVAEGLSTYSAEELATVRDWLTGGGYKLRVICHVRHLSPWLDSMIGQRVRGQLKLTIAEAVDEMLRAGGLVRPRLEIIRAILPQVEFFSHEASVRHPHGPPGFFLETIGLADQKGVRWVRANEGATDLGLRTLSLVNERFGRVHWRGTPDDLLRFHDQRGLRAMQNLRGPKFRLTAAEAAPLSAMVASENEWLRQELGPAFHDPDPSFPAQARLPSPEELQALRAAVRQCDAPLRDYLLERLLAPPTGIEPVSSA